MTERATGRDSDKFMLRFPDGMRDRIKAAADANGRSMNAEIIARLEASFAQRDVRDISPEEINAILRALTDRVADLTRDQDR